MYALAPQFDSGSRHQHIYTTSHFPPVGATNRNTRLRRITHNSSTQYATNGLGITLMATFRRLASGRVRAEIRRKNPAFYWSDSFHNMTEARSHAAKIEADWYAGKRGGLPDKTFGELMQRYADEESTKKAEERDERNKAARSKLRGMGLDQGEREDFGMAAAFGGIGDMVKALASGSEEKKEKQKLLLLSIHCVSHGLLRYTKAKV